MLTLTLFVFVLQDLVKIHCNATCKAENLLGNTTLSENVTKVTASKEFWQ